MLRELTSSIQNEAKNILTKPIDILSFEMIQQEDQSGEEKSTRYDEPSVTLYEDAILREKSKKIITGRPVLAREYRSIRVSDPVFFEKVLETPGMHTELLSSGVGEYTRTILYHSKDGNLFLVFANMRGTNFHCSVREVTESKIRADVCKYTPVTDSFFE